MPLIRCHKCGNELPTDSIFCNKCGSAIEKIQDDNEVVTNNVENKEIDSKIDNTENTTNTNTDSRKLSLKMKIIISCIAIITTIASVFIWQYNSANQIKSLYMQKKYNIASDKANNLFINLDPEIATIKDKLLPLSSPSNQLEHALKFKYEITDFGKGVYRQTLFEVIAYCIGWSKLAEERNCSNELNSIREEAKSMLVNEGFSGEDIETILLEIWNNNKVEFYPLGRDDEIQVKALIQEVADGVYQSEVEKIQNEKNPLRIEQTSLTTEGDYTYYSGSVKNYGDEIYSFVEVRVVYMDNNKNVLTTDWTYAVGSEGIRPNESVQFEIMTKVRGDVEYGTIEIYQYQ